MHRILIVEDDLDLSDITALHLTTAGYETAQVHSIAEARLLLEEETYSLVLLDILLSDGDGYSLSQEIRDRCRCPIIFMSCLDDSFSIISAFRHGGDDYMVKPARYEELLSRVASHLENARRFENRETPVFRETKIKLKRFTIDLERRRVLLDGNAETELSAIEFSLLQYMVDNKGKLLLYEELFRNVWGADCAGDVRTVLVHISNLRKKIDPEHVGIIETVRGAGYILSDV